MSATLGEDGLWRCDHCGKKYAREEVAQNHHPSEVTPVLEQSAAVIGQLIQTLVGFDKIAGAAVATIQRTNQEHDEFRAGLEGVATLMQQMAALVEQVSALQASVAQTIARLNAAGVPELPPETETPPDAES